MTYDDAIVYLNACVNYEQMRSIPYQTEIKLERIQILLEYLGNPHQQLRVAHIAGSKGKGSTCAFLYSILCSAGYRVGLFTSPHLVDLRERIIVGSEEGTVDESTWIPREAFAALVEYIQPFVDRVQTEHSFGQITYFELLTAIAFVHFLRSAVDVVVLETGLGGRLDSTNVVNPDVCGITPISHEHTDILGDTLQAIAREKAGIVKAGVPVCVAEQSSEALQAIELTADAMSSSLSQIGKELRWQAGEVEILGQKFSVQCHEMEYVDLSMRMLGAHQCANATLAIGMAYVLRRAGLLIPEAAIRRGVETATWPGRLECVAQQPFIMLDGAQNVASVEALLRGLDRHYIPKPYACVLGVSSDKPVDGMLELLGPVCQTFIVTAVDHPRAVDPDVLADAVRRLGGEVVVERAPQQALETARRCVGSGGTVLVTGSLYLVGSIRQHLKVSAVQ